MDDIRAANATAAAEARSLIRRGLKAALATVEAASGHPYASLVTVATEPDGSPVFLVSTLARHSRNLEADARACLLYDATDGAGDPLEGGRVSVFGRAEAARDDSARRRFLARHPHAEAYADFADFSFRRLTVSGGHYVGGFGRIHELSPAELLIDTAGAAALLAAEADIVSHMNEDHADALELYATRLLGAAPGPWRLGGCDPAGCDLVLNGRTLRLDFPEPVTDPQGARQALVALVQLARGG